MRASTVPSVMSTSGRRAVAAVVTAVVVGAAFASPAAAATRSVPARAVTGSDCPTEVADDVAASEVAVSCGREVEVLDERTEWQTVHALPDGQLRLDTSVAAQRTQVSGEWADIDTSLVETAEGITPTAPAVEMVFADGTPGQPLVRMEHDGHELAFDVPFEVGEPVVYGTTLEYRDVVEGVDLIVTVNEDGAGFSEVLRVDSPEAAADPRIAELAFPVEVSDGLDVAEADGGFVAADAAGEEVFSSPPPAMWDSSADLTAPKTTPHVMGVYDGTDASTAAVSVVDEVAVANRADRVAAPLQDDRAAVMDVDVNEGAVVVTPDADLLEAPDTVWPVYIDPSVNAGRVEWVSIRDDGWTDYNYTGDQGVGRCGTTGSPMYCSSVFTRRSIWEFNGLQAIAGIDPASVRSATFSVFGTHSYSCTPSPIDAYVAGDIWSGTRWPGSWGTRLASVNVAHKAGCDNNRWIEFDVTGGAREAAAAGAATLHLGLVAWDESTSAGWKRYRYDAQLSVTYNLAPFAPADVAFANPAAPCGTGAYRAYMGTTTPTIGATMTDPDKQNIRMDVTVYAQSSNEGKSVLNRGEYINQGQQLTSPDGRTKLILQGDGNLVLYGPNGALWETVTYGKGGAHLVMQDDGNLVLYTADWKTPVWHIGGDNRGGTALYLQDDGNLVVYTATFGVVWNSMTAVVSPVVWTGSTSPQLHGARQYLQVPSGLVAGRPYRIAVTPVDSDGRAGPTVSCEVTIDTQPPVTPTVESVTDGGHVAYPEEAFGGVPRQEGAFRFGPASSTDVVSYKYGIDTDVAGQPLEGSNPTLLHAPSSPGRHYLTVRSVDRAGNASLTARTYVFWVGDVPVAGRWGLDDNSGTTAIGLDSQALTLSPTVSWGDGARAEIWVDDDTDRALVFGRGGAATSATPVVTTNESYAVMAFVRLDNGDYPRTAVSQDGVTASGFELGYRKSGCPQNTTGPGCWAFTVNTADAASPAPVVLASNVEVKVGQWTQLTAIRDAATAQLRLYVCSVNRESDATFVPPTLTSMTGPQSPVNARGSLRLGEGLSGGSGVNLWWGAVSGVQVWKGPIDAEEFRVIRDSCIQATIPALQQ